MSTGTHAPSPTEIRITRALAAAPDRPHSYATIAQAVETSPAHAGACIRLMVANGYLRIVQQLRAGTVYEVSAPARVQLSAVADLVRGLVEEVA